MKFGRRNLAASLTATIVVATAVCAVADGPRRSTLRVVDHQEPAAKPPSAANAKQTPASSAGERGSVAAAETVDAAPPSANVPQEPLPQTTAPPPEFVEQAPNPYDVTQPTTAQPAPPFDPQAEMMFEQPPRARPLADYLHNRPRQQPLQRDSWLNRPYSFSLLIGGLFLDNPVQGVVDGQAGFLYGARLGWDFERRWGVESRLAASSPGVAATNGITPLPQADLLLWDLQWLWYPTGDTRWRPYVAAGFGLVDIQFMAPANVKYHDTVFGLPIGVGMKYRHSTRVAMRIDLTDNIAFASSQQDTMHNFSVTAGIEARFGGGTRRNYWPWNPGRDWR
jgi:hypothetical protein